MPLIEVGPTALTWPMSLTFNLLRSMVMTYSSAKTQGQQLVGSEDRVETSGRTDRRTNGSDRITPFANALGYESVVNEERMSPVADEIHGFGWFRAVL